jgi:signal transduction histidine kinase
VIDRVLPLRLDATVAAAAIVVNVGGTLLVANVQDHRFALDGTGIVLLVAASAALGWMSRQPLPVFALVVASVATYLLLDYPYGPVQLCLVYAMFELARLRPLRISMPSAAVATVVVILAVLSREFVDAAQPVLLAAVWASWLVVPWSIGALVQVRAAATQRARAELMARAALEERIRIAREVHDIAGHGFSAVAMQAGVALVVFDEQSTQVRESLEAIKATSTKALDELRALLDETQQGQGLRDLSSLVDSVRAAGLPVRLDFEPVAVPRSIDQTAYRVVQEALTNVLRHAGPTSADVRIRRERGQVVVEVTDHGVGVAEVRPGRGLAGMRSRVDAVGGTFIAESPAAGGFRVEARLPLGAQA